MRMLALALALFAPTFEPKLPFLELPLGLPDTTGWASAETEGVLMHYDVPGGLESGEPLATWLVARNVCAPSVKQCLFLAHVQVLSPPEDPKSRDTMAIVRYVFRGTTDVTAEGCLFSTLKDDTATVVFWSRRAAFWIYHDDAEEQVAELVFVYRLTGLIDRLADQGQLKVFSAE